MRETALPGLVARPQLIAAIGIPGALMLWFLSAKVHYVTDYSPASYSDYFWPRRLGLLAHLGGGLVAITSGLGQLWLGFAGKIRALHRILGRIYVAAVVLGVSGASYLVVTIPGHLAYATGLMGMALAALVATGMALLAIHRRDIVQHRQWMIRSYLAIFSFVTYRLASNLLRNVVHVPDDPVASDIDTMLAWASWALPLMIAEVLIQSRQMRRPADASSSAA